MIGRSSDLLVVLAWALLTVVVVLLFPSWQVVRVILGLPFVVFLPGYVLVAALYPRKADLNPVERAALSVGLSLALVPLIGLGLNYSPWGIRLEVVLSSLSLFIVAGIGASMYRRWVLAPGEAFTVEVALRSWAGLRWKSAALTLAAVGSLAGLAGVAAFMLASQGNWEGFTEFYVLGPAGEAAAYPTTLAPGEKLTAILGVVNHEGQDITYRIQARVDGQPVDVANHFTLGPEERWERTVTLIPSQVGNGQKVEFVLYKNGTSDAYRTLYLWVDVQGPPADALAEESPPSPAPAPTPSPTPAPPPPPPLLRAGPGGLVYIVRAGDTLTEVAERFGLSSEAVAAANGMAEPGPILADQELVISGTTYVVQAGDTLASIATAFAVDPAVIMEANGIVDPGMIYAGWELAIPGASP